MMNLSQKRVLKRTVAADTVEEKDVFDVNRCRWVLNAFPELALFLVNDLPDVVHRHLDGPSKPRVHFRAVFLQKFPKEVVFNTLTRYLCIVNGRQVVGMEAHAYVLLFCSPFLC